MRRWVWRCIPLITIFIFTTVHADELPAVSSWKRSAELGLLTTRGNTDTDSLNAKLAVQHKRTQWENAFKAETLRAKDASGTIASRDVIGFNTRYHYTGRRYSFGDLRYEADRFAGYERRTTEAVGYGYKFMNTQTLTLDGELGAGAQQTRLTDGTKASKAIARLAGKLVYNLSPTSDIKEALLLEHSDINTYTQSVTELKVKINSSLAMKLGITIKNNSDVPVDKSNTDTQTAVTLVYDF